ncbi:hypothetical protein C8R47DRAFT_918593, partial [Mycena vitilis]
MNNAAAASWLTGNIRAFLDAMGGTSVYKERLTNVVAQFVPVTFDPELEGALRVIEADANYTRGALKKARWIKPIHRRRVGQQVAHAVFGFSDDTAANSFLMHGCYVDGRLVFGHKLVTEPIRCMKCQKMGHIAAACPAQNDVCARCAGEHRTAECEATDEERACANCRAAERAYQGHGAADRSCPVFQDKLQFALERNPEAKYPYFLKADDPTTWV